MHPALPLPLLRPVPGDSHLRVPYGGAKETMLIKRRDNRLFSQTTAPDRFDGPIVSDFARRAVLVNSLRGDLAPTVTR